MIIKNLNEDIVGFDKVTAEDKVEATESQRIAQYTIDLLVSRRGRIRVWHVGS